MSCTPPKKNHPWHEPIKGERSKKTPPQKFRKVFVTLEVETQEQLSDLRQKEFWNRLFGVANGVWCLQAQANIARSEK